MKGASSSPSAPAIVDGNGWRRALAAGGEQGTNQFYPTITARKHQTLPTPVIIDFDRLHSVFSPHCSVFSTTPGKLNKRSSPGANLTTAAKFAVSYFSTSWLGVILLLPLLAAVFSFVVTPARRRNRLPSPPKLPLIGNLHQITSLPHRSLQALSAKHGPVMLLHFGCVPTIVVSSAAAVQEMVKERDVAFSSRPTMSVADRLLYGSSDVAFIKYGEVWRQLRRICVVHLLSHTRVNSFHSVRAEEATHLVNGIRAVAGRPVNLSEIVVATTCDVICRVAFGKKYPIEETGGSKAVLALLGDISEVLTSLSVRDYIPWLGWIDWARGLDNKVRNSSAKVDKLLEKVLEEHESTTRGDCSTDNILDILLSLGGGHDDGGFSLSRDRIKAVVWDMFGGGTDTTYVTIDWAMAELIKNPRIMKKAQEEIRRAVGLEEEITQEALEGMEYLKAVIKETLRLHPPLPLLIPRETYEATQLMGYDIPKGTRVMINAWAIGRDPVSWEKATEFWPERFLNSGAGLDFMGMDTQLVPFGAGRRSCPGVAFGMSVTSILLANLLFHFDWELPEGMNEDDMDMEEKPGIVLERKSSLVFVAKCINKAVKP